MNSTGPTNATGRPSRRALMKGIAWTTPTAVVATAAPAFAQSPVPSRCTNLPSIIGNNPPKGLTVSSLTKTTDPNVWQGPAISTNVDELLADVNALAALNGRAIRLNIGWDFVHKPGTYRRDDNGQIVYPANEPLSLDPLMVSDFKRVVAAARSKGMLIELMLIDTFYDQSYPEADWLKVTCWWWEAVAKALATSGDLFQVFNEADAYHYRRFTSQPTGAAGSAYRADMAAKMQICKGYLRASNPNALITTNLYGWPIGDSIEARWMSALVELAPVQDVITLDAYIDWNNNPGANLHGLLDRVNRVREAFCKPVSIGEIGDSTAGSGSNGAQQTRVLAVLDVLCRADSPLHSVFFYTMRDNEPAGSSGYDSEASFGYMTVDGQPKPVYNAVKARGGFC